MVDQYSMHRTQATCLCVEESLKFLKHLWSLQEDIIQARKLYHQHTAFSLWDPREIARHQKRDDSSNSMPSLNLRLLCTICRQEAKRADLRWQRAPT